MTTLFPKVRAELDQSLGQINRATYDLADITKQSAHLIIDVDGNGKADVADNATGYSAYELQSNIQTQEKALGVQINILRTQVTALQKGGSRFAFAAPAELVKAIEIAKKGLVSAESYLLALEKAEDQAARWKPADATVTAEAPTAPTVEKVAMGVPNQGAQNVNNGKDKTVPLVAKDYYDSNGNINMREIPLASNDKPDPAGAPKKKDKKDEGSSGLYPPVVVSIKLGNVPTDEAGRFAVNPTVELLDPKTHKAIEISEGVQCDADGNLSFNLTDGQTINVYEGEGDAKTRVAMPMADFIKKYVDAKNGTDFKVRVSFAEDSQDVAPKFASRMIHFAPVETKKKSGGHGGGGGFGGI